MIVSIVFHTTTIDMAAICSLSTVSEATLHQQYKRGLDQSCGWFNKNSHKFACGSGFRPYPEVEEVYLWSNVADVDEETFEDLGLSNFIIVQRCVGYSHFNQWNWEMTNHQCDPFNRGLEPWDGDESYHCGLEASVSYTSAMGL